MIEIAISSHEFARAKAGIYAAAGVKEYWLVDVPGRAIEIHRQPSAAGYADVHTVAETQTAACESVPGFSVTMAELLKR